jgi:2,5-dihydroxypyridine 5,6-dioxygenase
MNKFPVAFTSAAELVPMFRQVLEGCKVRSGEVVLLYTDTTFNPHYPAACLAAGLELGARVYQITVPARRGQIEDEPTIIRAWCDADIVIDLVSAGAHLFSRLNTLALEAGTRVLRIAEPVDVLERMLPSVEVRRRSEAGAKMLTSASELRVTSSGGTDLTFDIRGRTGVAQHGLADEPSRWDHWPSGLSLVAPVEESANGRLVLGVGDLIFTLGRYVSEPIECVVRDGRMASIIGGVDAMLLREWLGAQVDPRAYVLGLVAWGTDHRARWDRVAWHLQEPAGVMDSESFLGNVRIGLGANTSAMLRGKNPCKAHIDLQMRGCHVWLDKQLVIKAGEFTNPDWRSVQPTSRDSSGPSA